MFEIVSLNINVQKVLSIVYKAFKKNSKKHKVFHQLTKCFSHEYGMKLLYLQLIGSKLFVCANKFVLIQKKNAIIYLLYHVNAATHVPKTYFIASCHEAAKIFEVFQNVKMFLLFFSPNSFKFRLYM